MGLYKTGRLPATRPAALADLETYATGPLPTPPPELASPPGDYPMDGNDVHGDCTYAGAAHLVEAWDVEVDEADPVPDEPQVLAGYFAQTGGADTGCNEADVLKRWHTEGLFGRKIPGYAPVNPKSLLAIHQTVYLFGGAYLGILCPESAQQQFSANVPWTNEGEQTEDGHCIVATGYRKDGSLLCKTWGGEAVVTPGFLAAYLEEVWAILPPQFVEAGRNAAGIQVAVLQADLRRV